jgi:glycosyltransferase involved in cell wall biosynthesis
MKQIHCKQKLISHFVGLSGIGGVQSNFVEYMKNVELHNSRYQHRVYTVGSVDPHYQITNNVLDIRKISNLYKLILDIVSKNTIVHFYNNLSSFKVALLLVFLPVRKFIVHERGTIWNQKSSKWLVPRFIAWKADIVLSNSYATKTMLVKKISIPEKKIRVLHNGINTLQEYDYSSNYKKNNSKFRIGFIGRLDSPKGVHLLIDAMHYLKNERFELVIAGEGVLESSLRERASTLNNINFIGRVQNPYLFMNKIDLLVVPSIREPLGNVCLEAGLCRTPVLAANVDGIPEIIVHKVTGELIEATDEISIEILRKGVPLPEFVINPVNQELQAPKQINPSILARKILKLSSQGDKLKRYADRLHDKVIACFSMDAYRKKLHTIYREIDIKHNKSNLKSEHLIR